MGEKKRAVKDECYYSVFGWMTNPNKMNLSGLKLQLFAIIYGFCQAQPMNGYYASNNYLAEFTGATPRGVRKALDELIEKGYIIRTPQEEYATYKYVAIVPDFDEKEEEQRSKTDGNNVPNEELSSPSRELSSPSKELSSSSKELSSADGEQSSTNNIIKDNNNISKKPTKKEGGSVCSFADAPNVRITFSELLYLNRYYGQNLVTKYIQKLELYLQRTGKEYKSHLDVIEKWICEDNPGLRDVDT